MNKLFIITAGMLAGNNYFCSYCKKQIKGFRDSLSVEDYKLNGLCQECQDKPLGFGF